jgi:hypothetical protein
LLAVLTVFAACGAVAPGARVAATPKPPPAHAAWQWQLQGRLDLSVLARVYDVDGFDASRAQVARLHRAGRYVVCYVDVGSWERWRPDAARFPREMLGASNGWPGERWIDVRRIDSLAPLLRARFARCRAKGFDAVEPDNVDGYANKSGFPLTYKDQLAYNRMLATEAHERGLAIALKNDTAQVDDLVNDFDFAVVEECFSYNECGRYSPFVRAGKAVFVAEYDTKDMATRCQRAQKLNFGLIFKRLDLGAWRRTC